MTIGNKLDNQTLSERYFEETHFNSLLSRKPNTFNSNNQRSCLPKMLTKFEVISRI